MRMINDFKAVILVIILIPLTSCQGGRYKLRSDDYRTIKLIEKDCSCDVRFEGDSNDRTNGGVFWIILNFNQSLINNCEDLSYLEKKEISEKYHSWLRNKNGHIWESHDKLIVKFYSSTTPASGLEIPSCEINIKL